MKNKALAAINRYNMLKPGQNVTVALSGGADSVALLHLLYSLCGEYEIKLSAAHLNHGIRGAEAERDAEFCRTLCRERNIPFISETVNVPEISAQTGESEELCARRLRYEFLERVSVGTVATAHTASDVAETLLFNLARGTGIKGMSGIPPVRDNIIRPLILATRQEVEEYCRENGLNYVTDSTNLTDEYTRNFIRHAVVPQMEKVNSGFADNAANTAALLRDDSCFLEQEAQKAYSAYVVDGKLSLKSAELHMAILSRVAARFIEEATGVSHESVHIRKVCRLIKSGSGLLPLKNGMEAEAVRGHLRVFSRESTKPFCVDAKLGVTELNGYKIEISECDISKRKINKMLLNGCIDCDKMVGKLVIRSRQEGDALKPVGRGVTKSLKNVFSELDIPFEKRGLVPILADEEGVLWVPGTAVAERVAATKNSQKVIQVKDCK